MRYGRMLLAGLCLMMLGAIAKIDPNVEKVAELRKTYPTGIVVVDAQWGKNKDVTEDCQAMVDGDSLTVYATDEAFLEGDERGNQLKITYDDGKGIHKKTVGNGGKLQVGDNVTSFVQMDRGMVSVKSEVESLRKKYPTGLLVLDARWAGRGRDAQNERDLCQTMVSGDSLTLVNKAEAFRETDGHDKELQVVVFDGTTAKTLKAEENGVIQVGDKVTSFVRTGAGLQSVDKVVAELRKKYPTGLLILDANRGGNRDAMDETDLCQSLVWGDSLTVENSQKGFRDGHDNNMDLAVTYFDGEVLKTTKVGNNGTLQIGPKVTSFVKLNQGLQNLQQTAAKLGAKHPGGILIMNAEWGKDNEWRDVQDVVQSWVSGDSLNVKVNPQAFGQEGSNGEELKVTYYSGNELHETKVGQGSFLKVMAILPDALSGLVMLPDTVTVGDTVTHEFGVKGVYRLESGPDGATLSATGRLIWKPTAEQAGGQEFKITCTINGQAYTTTVHCEVVTADGTGANAGAVRNGAVARTPKRAGQARKVETSGEHYYVANVDFEDSLLLEKDELTVLGADGVSVVRAVKLEHAYVRVAERATYFVGIRLEPMVMDLLDKNSGRVIKTIKLGYRAFRDMALLPNQAISFVSVEYADSVPRDRIVVVDESTGEVREPKDLSGTFLQMDRAGKHLWAGLKDIYENGVEYHMNPDWNLIEIPQYGNVDMLLRFDVVDGGLVLKDHVMEAGGNGYGIRVSPDGERVTYLSFVGFPLFSKNIAAWAGMDFEKKPVVYEVNGKAECRTMNYHPVLPLVVVPKENGVIIFGRESGDEETGRVNLPASMLGNGRVVEAYFSADGMNVVLDCDEGGKSILRKVPLIMSAEEKAKVAAGVKPLPVGVEQKVNPGLRGM